MIITGTDGFIGGVLHQRCLSVNHPVAPIPERVGRDTKLDSSDGIFVHLGAEPGIPFSIEHPLKSFEANVASTVEYLAMAVEDGIDRFLFASSCAVSEFPASPYAADKGACEGYCWAYLQSYGLNTLSMRFSNVYGPGSHNKQSVIASMIKSALDEGVIYIHGSGEQMRDFVHVDDVCDAIMLAAHMDKPACGTVNICTGERTSIARVADLIAGMTDAEVQHMDEREGEVEVIEFPVPGGEFPWEAQRDLVVGLRETVDWFRALREKAN